MNSEQTRASMPNGSRTHTYVIWSRSGECSKSKWLFIFNGRCFQYNVLHQPSESSCINDDIGLGGKGSFNTHTHKHIKYSTITLCMCLFAASICCWQKDLLAFICLSAFMIHRVVDLATYSLLCVSSYCFSQPANPNWITTYKMFYSRAAWKTFG